MKAMWSKRVRAGCLSMACLLAFTALNLLPAGRGGAAHPVAAEEVPPLKTVYASPAEDWESEALPLGNGFLGAMLFGGVGSDRIQINEHSVWSGGPGASADYDGGVKTGASEAKAALQAVRNELQQTAVSFSQTSEAYIDSNGNVVSSDYPAESQALLNNLEQLKGEKDYFGSYQTLGNLVIQDGSYHIPEIMEITTNGNPSNGSELAVQLFDGDAGTKWYAGDSHANTRPLWIQWKYNQPFTANGYTLTSANDVPGRDPRSWTLSGSNDGTNFTVIDSRGGEAFSDRGQERSFSLSSTVMYTYYRLSITETLTNNLPCQLAEITLQNANPVTESYSDYQRSLNLDEAVANVFLPAGWRCVYAGVFHFQPRKCNGGAAHSRSFGQHKQENFCQYRTT